MKRWTENVVARQPMTLREAIEVEGVRHVSLGPRWQIAKIRVRAEPCDRFECRVELGSQQSKLERHGYIEESIFGLLDVLFVSGQHPLKNVRLALVGADDDEINSSQHAFRMAGRDAGKKVLDAALAQMVRA